MSPASIQEQIDELQQSIDDLTYSPSGVNMYTGSQTITDYEEVWARTMRDFDDGVADLDEGIVEASGLLRIINNGLLFHRH